MPSVRHCLSPFYHIECPDKNVTRHQRMTRHPSLLTVFLVSVSPPFALSSPAIPGQLGLDLDPTYGS
jgi:hypothetical protein